MESIADRAERLRDLKSEITGLSLEDRAEFVIEDISPGRNPITLYSLSDGCPENFPAYMVKTILSKRRADGRYAFTADPMKAPTYRRGNILCFLNSDSAEWPIMQELGLGQKVCESKHLGSLNSKLIHGQHRHKQEYAAWQAYLTDQKQQTADRRQEAQLEATLAMAKGVSAKPKARRRKLVYQHKGGVREGK